MVIMFLQDLCVISTFIYTSLQSSTMCVCVQSLNHSLQPHWIVASQGPLTMGFPRQEYWCMLPFPPPGGLPKPGIKPVSFASTWQVNSLPLHYLRIPVSNHNTILFSIPKTVNFALVGVYSAFFKSLTFQHIFQQYLFLCLYKGINITCDYCLPLIEKHPLPFCKYPVRTPT